MGSMNLRTDLLVLWLRVANEHPSDHIRKSVIDMPTPPVCKREGREREWNEIHNQPRVYLTQNNPASSAPPNCRADDAVVPDVYKIIP